MSPASQAELERSLEKVIGVLDDTPQTTEVPAEVLNSRLDALRRQNGAAPTDHQGNRPVPSQEAKSSSGPRPSVTGRIGNVARDTLAAIDFTSFVASLIQGTFSAIVDASIQQMEAYSSLLSSVAKTVDQFMEDNITEDMARDHLADNYGDVFGKDLSKGYPKLTVASSTETGGSGGPGLPSFLQDMGFFGPEDIDEQALNDTVIPETRRKLAETRHQSLATMVLLGLNRIVVDDGEVNAKLIFQVNTSETSSLTFNKNQPTNWTMAGNAGRNAFGASGLMVTTTNVNAQSDINVRADLTGEVRVKFRSETFPLERFADSSAIQLINSYATPMPLQQPAAPADNTANEAPSDDETATAQSLPILEPSADPWAPGGGRTKG